MDTRIYYEDSVKKRQGKGEIWAAYWAVLWNDTISLYAEDKSSECCEVIHIPPGSRCALVKRRTYSFRFKLVTEEDVHYFKCATNLQRHRWMHTIELAAKERDFTLPPGRSVSGILHEPILTDADLRRYFYGEDKPPGKDEINNNNDNKDFEVKPGPLVERVSSARFPRLKVAESRRVKSAPHLPWTKRWRKVHASDAGIVEDLGGQLENLAVSDDRMNINAISSNK